LEHPQQRDTISPNQANFLIYFYLLQKIKRTSTSNARCRATATSMDRIVVSHLIAPTGNQLLLLLVAVVVVVVVVVSVVGDDDDDDDGMITLTATGMDFVVFKAKYRSHCCLGFSFTSAFDDDVDEDDVSPNPAIYSTGVANARCVGSCFSIVM
jgi:hypothetical protein